jgi:hypothetical protein
MALILSAAYACRVGKTLAAHREFSRKTRDNLSMFAATG